MFRSFGDLLDLVRAQKRFEIKQRSENHIKGVNKRSKQYIPNHTKKRGRGRR